jgi:hypothetical protein
MKAGAPIDEHRGLPLVEASDGEDALVASAGRCVNRGAALERLCDRARSLAVEVAAPEQALARPAGIVRVRR